MEWLPELHKEYLAAEMYLTNAHVPDDRSTVARISDEDDEEGATRPYNESTRVNDEVDATYDDAEEANSEPIEFALYEGIDLSAQYWGPTREITEEALTSLISKHVANKVDGINNGHCSLLSRQHGVYNSVYILQLEGGEKVCVRVPACGWSKRWNQYDAELLRQTALAMKMLEEKAKVPLPRVIAYDCSLENDVGAPFVILSCIGGICARQVWNTEEGVVSKEIRRQNILRSMAQAMAGLRHLKHPKSGSLWFGDDPGDEPVVGESWNLRIEGYIIEREFAVAEGYCSTREKVMNDLQSLLEVNGFPDHCQDLSTKGGLELYRLITGAFLVAAEVPEINTDEDFVLTHADFDIQNLMVDDEGNLTGVLDWDGLSSQPRQAGWSMVPFWLQNDWSPTYQWPPAIGANFAMIRPDEFEWYRQSYARYLWEACNGLGDCCFTAKSHIYRAFLNSTSERYAAMRFVENVLADILPRSPSLAYCAQVGKYGFRSGEKEWLEARLREFFRPEPPLGVTEKNSGEGFNSPILAGVESSWPDRCLGYIMEIPEKILHFFSNLWR